MTERHSVGSDEISPSLSKTRPPTKGESHKAVMAYQASGPGQISFEVGETLNVLDKLKNGMTIMNLGVDYVLWVGIEWSVCICGLLHSGIQWLKL